MQYSYNDLVPQELADRLIAIRDSATRNSWAVGDITQAVILSCKLNFPQTELQQIYAAVGMFVGKASRTVREYHRLAMFYVPETREVYSVLAYDHFRFSASMGDRWEECLMWAVMQADDLHRPATVDSLIAHFTPPEMEEETEEEEEEKEPGTIWQQMFRSASTQVMQANNWLNEDLPSKIISAIQDYADAAQALVERLPQEARR